VQWSTIRLLLSTVLTESWATRQVDHTNAFAQAAINEEVYLEYPKLFGPKSRTKLVLKLVESLYGLRQVPRSFFEKLREGLLERGYIQSQLDPCLFLKNQIMCVVYADDTSLCWSRPFRFRTRDHRSRSQHNYTTPLLPASQ
jgi:Reverse transcriptase (RNA-dependent DNA polymerase)